MPKRRVFPWDRGGDRAQGLLVAYSMGITEIDPIAHGLLFERFLNPERVSPPDIDIDFCIEGREEVIQYVRNKYGADHVAQIITFGKMQARAVIRDVGRALDMPYSEVDRIAKMIPNTLNITLKDALDQEPRLKELAGSNPEVQKLLTLAQSLEGLTAPCLDPRRRRGDCEYPSGRGGTSLSGSAERNRNPVPDERCGKDRADQI